MDVYVKRDGSELVRAGLVTAETADELAEACGGVVVEERAGKKRYPGVNVPTPEGNKRASMGMVVYQDLDGDYHVAYRDEFSRDYVNKSEEK